MPNPLETYQKMRDFGDTPEPQGSKKRSPKQPIFVIQKHRASHLHYDFRLEMEGVLKSWAVPKGPSYDPAVRRLAMMTEDHPYDYASFEGVIPEGNYGAGNVIIWDQGTWELIEPGSDPVKALESGKLTFRLKGKKMFGEWALIRIKGRGASARGNEWLLLKHQDRFANDEVDITTVAPRSVVSDRSVDELSDDVVWQSNRSARPTRGTTVASRIRTTAREKAKKTTGAKKTTAGAKKKRTATKAPSRNGSSASRATKPAKRAARAARRSAPTPAAPSRSASSRKRSSRAATPPSTRSTRRRPPR
jgi:bifunctional non-homologous end joining protein LigD